MSSRIYPSSTSSSSNGGPKVVQMDSRKRWVPACSQILPNGTIINNDPSAPWTGTIHRGKVPVYANFSKIVLGISNVGTMNNIGESLAGAADSSDIRIAANRVQANLEVNGVNLGAFSWFGNIDPTMTDAFKLSFPISATVSSIDNVWVRLGVHKFDTTINSQVVANRIASRLGITVCQRNVTTNVAADVANTNPVGGNDCFIGYPFGETADPNLNSALIRGDSLAYGGTGWWINGVQGANPLSNTMDGSMSDIEIALYRRSNPAQGVVYFNISEPASAMWVQVNQGKNIVGTGNGFEPSRYSARYAIDKLGFTDDFVSFWTNEFGYASGGFNEANWKVGMEEIARKIILQNHVYLRRTWFVVDPVQTQWTGGGTTGDLGLSPTAYLDAQTPVFNGIPVGGPTALHEWFVEMLDGVCNELGSAWVYNRAKFYQQKNTRGELAWKKISDGVGGWFAPTGGNGPSYANDFTHPGHAAAVSCATDMEQYFPTRTQTSGFPALGLLNP
jgi:hypothetical protein